MAIVPEGAQLSEDGNWFWDGSQWQSVSGEESSTDEALDPEALKQVEEIQQSMDSDEGFAALMSTDIASLEDSQEVSS
jgi:hypothetical protein